MAKYRIVEVTYPSGNKQYQVQKRFLGFLWWYDPFEDGLYSDGYCDTYEEAINLINNRINYKEYRKVVWTNE